MFHKINQGKYEDIPVFTLEAYGENGGQLYAFLTSSLGGGK